MDEYYNKNVKSLYMSEENLIPALIKFIRFSPPVSELPEGEERDRDKLVLFMYEILRKESSLDANDDFIYKKIHKTLYDTMIDKKQHKNSKIYNPYNMDSEKIALSFVEMIPENYKIKTFLDVGCADGSITSLLAKKLGINKKNAHGTDVQNVTTDAFTFHLAKKEDTRFSFLKDNSMDMVIASMSLHKLVHQEDIIKDIARVVKPKGLFIIFEHDAKTKDYSLVLNIMYGLYAMAWSNPMNDPDFLENYYAKYRSELAWSNLFLKEGFEVLDVGNKEPEAPRNPCRFYMNSFFKK